MKNSKLVIKKTFQFQYGAIKRREEDKGYIKKYLFQFQYGAIKRRDG